MELKSENDIVKSIETDAWMMDILKAASQLNLPDWWICAGFIRSKIWDALHGFDERSPIEDIDVIYFNEIEMDEEVEKSYQQKLLEILPNIPWSVKNQARMHIVNDIKPYTCSIDAISKFPETATAIGVKLDSNYQVVLTAPHGVTDVINLHVKPTNLFLENEKLHAVYRERVIRKNWTSTWKEIKINF
ncbi:nucleotidyltransferase family protein [Aquibacillus rhizosphaerae]|uniref:Nucleotidyltransferase family protein n=1 Tax=Aquibacillus rhizosphaerae TaxID=3051431 RepID=A0ABT7L494_9BACI|nr:nucleotidyltransferase family protein [Aquibacillus sp. LR5S19]MDL4840693.1 nucleotidyltransferase family protein [Aquibacillus sp. LR5S19]